jgi:hypothetical protein
MTRMPADCAKVVMSGLNGSLTHRALLAASIV